MSKHKPASSKAQKVKGAHLTGHNVDQLHAMAMRKSGSALSTGGRKRVARRRGG